MSMASPVGAAAAVAPAPAAAPAALAPANVVKYHDAVADMRDQNNNKSYIHYVASCPSEKMFGYTAYVLLNVGVGAGIGAAVCSGAGGIGAGPGAGIGAAAGLVHGIVTAIAIDFACSFAEWAGQVGDKISKDFTHKVTAFVRVQNGEYICPLSMEFPREPVSTPFSTQVFERIYLEKHVRAHGDCPITHRKMTVNDIKPCISGYLACHKIAEQMISNPALLGTFNPEQRRGLAALRNDLKANSEGCVQAEMKLLCKLVEDKLMTVDRFAEAAAQLKAAQDVRIDLGVK